MRPDEFFPEELDKMDAEDLRQLRAAKAAERDATGVSLDEARRQLGV